MNSYAPGLFRNLNQEEIDKFEQAAVAAFNATDDTLLVEAIHHPVYRRELGRLIVRQAEAELGSIEAFGQV
jgi:hypothetical protein